jgi:hypothetical protein
MQQPAIQDFYPDDLAHCYGCGRLNEHGLHVRSAWDGEETVAVLTPRPYHTAIPGYVYGGLIASLVDCHGTGSAALAAYRAAGREPGTAPPLRFVTASLKVDYLRPTPMGVPLEARGRIAVFFLPGYSPDLNPDEFLNQDVNSNALGRQRPPTQTDLMAGVRSYLRSTQHQPEVVKRYFHAESVRYAAA